jgi:ketosteroid isomerase-like protein
MVRRCAVAAVFVGVAVLLVGCAGGKVKGPSDQELVSQAMHEWKAAWAAKDVERIMACVSPNFSTSDGDGPDAIRKFAAGLSQQAEAVIDMALDEMEITIEEEKASVRGVRGKISGRNREGEKFEGQFGLSIALRKEEGNWLITWLDAWDLEG